MLDLVNAAATDELPAAAPVHRTAVDAGIAVTRAAASFAAGEQVLEDYGQPNHVLFLYHGFVLPANKHDCARLDLRVGAGAGAAAPPPGVFPAGGGAGDDDAEAPPHHGHRARSLVAQPLRRRRFVSGPRYTACVRAGLLLDDDDDDDPHPGAQPTKAAAADRLFQVLAVKHDEELPSKAGPSLKLLLLFADELSHRLAAYAPSGGAAVDDAEVVPSRSSSANATRPPPFAARTLLDAERQHLADLYDEVTEQARDHEAFIPLKR